MAFTPSYLGRIRTSVDELGRPERWVIVGVIHMSRPDHSGTAFHVPCPCSMSNVHVKSVSEIYPNNKSVSRLFTSYWWWQMARSLRLLTYWYCQEVLMYTRPYCVCNPFTTRTWFFLPTCFLYKKAVSCDTWYCCCYSVIHGHVLLFFYRTALSAQQNHQQSTVQEKTRTQNKNAQQHDNGKGTTMVHSRHRNGFHGHKAMESTNN
jgi:hypothetical protein